MPRILSEVVLDAAAIGRLEMLPGVAVQMIPPHEGRWDVPAEMLRGAEILLCKFPPGNLERLADLKVMQLSTVGYEHLRNLGLADKPLRICNARGIFDTAIAEWNLAMMVNLVRDLRAMIRNLQIQSEILNQQLEVIEQINQTKKEQSNDTKNI